MIRSMEKQTPRKSRSARRAKAPEMEPEREPTMREVLDSIRRIIAEDDDDNGEAADADAALAILCTPDAPHLWPLALYSGALIFDEWGNA